MARFEVAVCSWAGIIRPCIAGRSHSYSEAFACCCLEKLKIGISQKEGAHLLRVSIFGLGYVGTVCAACLAQDGHQVIGVDPVPTKVDLINAGKSTIIEAEIGRIDSQSGRRRDAPRYRQDLEAVENSDLSFICVGTPSQINGNLDLTHVRHVCEQIGRALKDKRDRHTVVIRSTILPGTMRKIVIPVLEEYSGKKAGIDFGVCNNPEFLREGSAVKDFRIPRKPSIGELDQASGDPLAALYAELDTPDNQNGFGNS